MVFRGLGCGLSPFWGVLRAYRFGLVVWPHVKPPPFEVPNVRPARAGLAALWPRQQLTK